jgi:polyhydroxyalkanoate synthesis repressor PhaR
MFTQELFAAHKPIHSMLMVDANDQGDKMPSAVRFKKYANRRLYDTEQSTYVTLTQLADYIRAGREVIIVDAKSGEDVTAFTLTQIVLEEVKNKNALLPVPLLHLIIRYGDNLMAEFFEKYLHQIFKNFVAHKKAMDGQFQQWIELGLNMTQSAQKNFSGINPFHSFFDPFGQHTEKDKKE